MITPEQARQRATDNFLSGLNCTQSVVEVFAEELGYDKNMVMSLALPFGGGTCRMRETCGTFSGIMICLGMAIGVPDGNKQHKDEIYAEGQKLAAEFKKGNGSIICRELLGLVPLGSGEKIQIKTAVSEERTAEYYKKRPCPELCGYAAELFATWLMEKNKGENL